MDFPQETRDILYVPVFQLGLKTVEVSINIFTLLQITCTWDNWNYAEYFLARSYLLNKFFHASFTFHKETYKPFRI